MRFYTKHECEEWLRGLERTKPDARPDANAEFVRYPSEPHRIFFMAHWIATTLTYRRPVLLWITEWGIWNSSENWHMYYKLRHSYSNQQLLHEAPGHLFLEHEAEDLASFVQLSMLNGWGGYILTQADYVNAFFSHDEYINFYGGQRGNLAEVRELFGSGAK
jgi:hypothetical protein